LSNKAIYALGVGEINFMWRLIKFYIYACGKIVYDHMHLSETDSSALVHKTQDWQEELCIT
jgi:hypothetical protein